MPACQRGGLGYHNRSRRGRRWGNHQEHLVGQGKHGSFQGRHPELHGLLRRLRKRHRLPGYCRPGIGPGSYGTYTSVHKLIKRQSRCYSLGVVTTIALVHTGRGVVVDDRADTSDTLVTTHHSKISLPTLDCHSKAQWLERRIGNQGVRRLQRSVSLAYRNESAQLCTTSFWLASKVQGNFRNASIMMTR